MPSKAEEILDSVFEELEADTPKDKYENVYEVIAALERRNESEVIPVSTTGKITELLVEIALNLSAENSFFPITQRQYKWVGDFALLGIPFNVIVSVKSFTAKERLLVSGSGSALSPTIGYGWFKKPEEFKNIERLLAYKMRGFTSIYMPVNTYNQLPDEAKQFKNLNNRGFLRTIENFPKDISEAMNPSDHFAEGIHFADPFEL